MVSYYGDFVEDDTVNIPFNTFDSNDPANSVTATDLVASDIFVHKDGSATAITTDGATIDIDAPGVGAHMITIDTSADAAYSTGSEYAVRINGVTVDSGTVNAWVGAFSIERAGGVLALMKATTLASIKAETALIVADTNELQTDDIPGTLGSPAGASISADLLVIDNFVDGLESSLGTPSDFGSGTSTIAANLQDLADDGTAVYSRATDSMQAIRDRGDAAWTTGSGTGLTALASGTAQGGTASTIQLASGESFANSEPNGNAIKITAGTGVGQSRVILSYVGATDTATVTPNWITNPDATSVYEMVEGSSNITAVSNVAEDLPTATALATAQTDLDTLTGSDGATLATTQGNYAPLLPTVAGRTLDVSAGGEAGLDWANVGSPTTAVDLSGTDIQLCDTVTTNSDMRGTDSAALASEVTAVRMATLTDWINGGRLDLLLDAIKAKTDSLTFSTANQVDANSLALNSATVVGDGNATPWDGA